MGKLGKIVKAIGRSINGAIKDMAADRTGGGMRDANQDIPPDWERKDLGI